MIYTVLFGARLTRVGGGGPAQELVFVFTVLASVN
jgi:hypothetical protein